MTTFWISCVTNNGPLGICLVKAETPEAALLLANQLQLIPEECVESAILPLPEGQIEQLRFECNKFYNMFELQRFDMRTVGENEEVGLVLRDDLEPIVFVRK